MTYLDYGLLSVCGVAAGFCNTIAGGGSMFVVPLMIFLGLPATAANASLRPAILSQNIFALLGFRRAGLLNREFLLRVLPLVLLALPAALLGAGFVTTKMDDEDFKKALAVVFVGLAILMVLWRPHALKKPHRWLGFLLIMAAGFYGGFIQIGVGFLLITALLLGDRWQMAQAHAAKIAIVGLYTLLSLPIFILSGKVDWLVALALALGQALGGSLGSRFATRVQEKHLRRLYVFLMLVFALVLYLK